MKTQRVFTLWLSILTLLFLMAFPIILAKCEPCELYKENAKRTVKLKGELGYCTGFVVKTNRVLTCFHCTHNHLKVDGQDIKVIKTDEQHDLALLEMPTGKFSKVNVTTAQVGDDIYTFGYPMDASRPVFSKGYIMDYDGERIWAQLTVFHGDSGSGVFDCHGSLVGIVNATTGENPLSQPVAMIRDGKVLKDFLKE